jgi:hypothetical protein
LLIAYGLWIIAGGGSRFFARSLDRMDAGGYISGFSERPAPGKVKKSACGAEYKEMEIIGE